jgi:hypothetical protein
MSSVGDRQADPKSTDPFITMFITGQFQDYMYMQRFRYFHIDPLSPCNFSLSDRRPDLEASGCRDFKIVNNFRKYQILSEI